VLGPICARRIIDAQLPRRLVAVLHQRGHDAVHTLDLPEGNHTPDDRLCDLCGSDERVLISKDRDIVDSYIVRQDEIWLRERQAAERSASPVVARLRAEAVRAGIGRS
jgi:hypothetical protein